LKFLNALLAGRHPVSKVEAMPRLR